MKIVQVIRAGGLENPIEYLAKINEKNKRVRVPIEGLA